MVAFLGVCGVYEALWAVDRYILKVVETPLLKISVYVFTLHTGSLDQLMLHINIVSVPDLDIVFLSKRVTS